MNYRSLYGLVLFVVCMLPRSHGQDDGVLNADSSELF